MVEKLLVQVDVLSRNPPIGRNYGESLVDDDGEFVLDMCDYGIGAVLSQVQEGDEKVVAYASRTLTRTDKKLLVTRKELFAVLFFLCFFSSSFVFAYSGDIFELGPIITVYNGCAAHPSLSVNKLGGAKTHERARFYYRASPRPPLCK
jgi:hypothetical protein